MQLNYKKFGSGQAIIILHGIFGMLDNWNGFAKLLSENFLVYTIDQRNHGRSPHSSTFDYEILTEDLSNFIELHKIINPIIIGHSMGGKVAMHFALNHPKSLKNLIVIDIGIKKYPPDHIKLFNALLSLDLSIYKSRESIDLDLAKSIKIKRIRQFLLKNILKNKYESGYKWKMNLDIIYNNYYKIIDRIESENQFTNETLFIKGQLSDYIVEKDVTDIKKLFPNSKFITIDNAGHWLHAEQPRELLKIVRGFCDFIR